MVLLTWKTEYETGIAAVDYEHRRLIGLINELYAGLSRPARETAVSAFFGDLYAAISAHFALEERVMRECAYLGYRDHKADHERLLDDIRDLMDEYETGLRAEASTAIRARLETWFMDHFRIMDAPLHTALGPH